MWFLPKFMYDFVKGQKMPPKGHEVEVLYGIVKSVRAS